MESGTKIPHDDPLAETNSAKFAKVQELNKRICNDKKLKDLTSDATEELNRKTASYFAGHVGIQSECLIIDLTPREMNSIVRPRVISLDMLASSQNV